MSKPKTEGSRRDFMTSAGAATGLAALATLFGGSKIVNAQELGINAMGPTPEQAQAFAQLPDRPVVMGNWRAITGNMVEMWERFCRASAPRSYFPANARLRLSVVPNGTRLLWFATRIREPYYKWPNLKSIEPLVEIAAQVWKAR